MNPEQAIYAELTEIARDLFDDDDLVLTPELSANDVPEWDSFNHINLIVAVEQKFGVKFQTAELEAMQNIGHLVSLIEQKLLAKQP